MEAVGNVERCKEQFLFEGVGLNFQSGEALACTERDARGSTEILARLPGIDDPPQTSILLTYEKLATLAADPQTEPDEATTPEDDSA